MLQAGEGQGGLDSVAEPSFGIVNRIRENSKFCSTCSPAFTRVYVCVRGSFRSHTRATCSQEAGHYRTAGRIIANEEKKETRIKLQYPFSNDNRFFFVDEVFLPKHWTVACAMVYLL